ncbi:hypothetical protein TELCIR_06851 [Teladorsagia circumcincta]|uniref:Uncharacterized protein n=1 Tax=Teladorsagia circumcincta TaxID=45464 RepID=A0A2G9ULY5_TELCI|nr:hypothetical protein TELCIR_06851 [Teladorsagia circumcincta]
MSEMLKLLCVSVLAAVITHYVTAKKDIYVVTHGVLGLKRDYFERAESMETLVGMMNKVRSIRLSSYSDSFRI